MIELIAVCCVTHGDYIILKEGVEVGQFHLEPIIMLKLLGEIKDDNRRILRHELETCLKVPHEL